VAGRGERARGRARRRQGEGESCDEPRGDLQPAELMSTALVLCSPNCAIRFARTSYRTVAVHENSRPPSLPFPLPSFFSSLFSSSPFFFSSPFFLFLVSRAVRAEKIRRKNIDDDGLYRRATRRKAVFDLGRGGGSGRGPKGGRAKGRERPRTPEGAASGPSGVEGKSVPLCVEERVARSPLWHEFHFTMS